MMKTITSLFAACALSVSAMAETSPVTFRGILNLGSDQSFSVATEGGARSAWVGIGDSFNGYEITAYNAEESVLIVTREGEEFRLPLAGARGATDDAASRRAEAERLLQSMKFQEMMATSIEQQKEMMENMFRQMAQQGGQEVSAELLAEQMRFLEAFHEALDWEGMQEDMVQVYGDTLSSDELRGLIDFYSTPAGEGFIQKQGELMQRGAEVMQPRIMRAMGELQPMMQEMQERAMERQRQNPPVEAPTPAE